MTPRTTSFTVLVVLLLLAASAGAQTVRWFQKTNATTLSVDVSDGGEFAVEGRDSSLFLYDRAGDRVWGKAIPGVSRVAISPDAAHIAVAAEGKILLFDRAGGMLWQYVGGGVRFTSVDLSRDRVIGGTSGGRLVMLDFSGNLLWSKSLCSEITGLSFSPDAGQIAAAASTCIYLLDSRGNERVTRNSDGEARTAAGGRDRIAYETRSGVLASVAAPGPLQGPFWRLSTETAAVALSMAPAGWFLMASGPDLYQVSDGGSVLKRWRFPSPGQSGSIEDAALSPDGSVLLFAVPGNLTLWEGLPSPPAGPATPTPSPSPTARVVFVCPDGSRADAPTLCPETASPAPPSPRASPPGPSPAASVPPPSSPQPGPVLPPIPVGPIVAAAIGIAGVVLGVRWVRKNRESIDRWRLQRRMRRI